MVNSKIKKSASTLTGLTISLILVIGIFTGCYIWLTSNATDAGVTVDSKYNDTYSQLIEQRGGLKSNVDTIKTSAENIIEADTPYQVAWNGLKGLGATLKLPINFVSTAEQTMDVTVLNLDVIPSWVKVLIFIGIVAFVVFMILAILKGEPRL